MSHSELKSETGVCEMATELIEKAFCGKCMRVQLCRVTSLPDQWLWHCCECGSLADSDYKDNEQDDKFTEIYRKGDT